MAIYAFLMSISTVYKPCSEEPELFTLCKHPKSLVHYSPFATSVVPAGRQFATARHPCQLLARFCSYCSGFASAPVCAIAAAAACNKVHQRGPQHPAHSRRATNPIRRVPPSYCLPHPRWIIPRLHEPQLAPTPAPFIQRTRKQPNGFDRRQNMDDNSCTCPIPFPSNPQMLIVGLNEKIIRARRSTAQLSPPATPPTKPSQFRTNIPGLSVSIPLALSYCKARALSASVSLSGGTRSSLHRYPTSGVLYASPICYSLAPTSPRVRQATLLPTPFTSVPD